MCFSWIVAIWGYWPIRCSEKSIDCNAGFILLVWKKIRSPGQPHTMKLLIIRYVTHFVPLVCYLLIMMMMRSKDRSLGYHRLPHCCSHYILLLFHAFVCSACVIWIIHISQTVYIHMCVYIYIYMYPWPSTRFNVMVNVNPWLRTFVIRGRPLQ